METTIRFPTTARFATAQSNLLDFISIIMDDQLTGMAKRVLAYLSDRAIRHRTSSEAVPVADIAAALRVHRNAVSLAFNQLETAGLVKRIAVKHRGAPTRTKLVGRAARFAGAFASIVINEPESVGPIGPDPFVKSLHTVTVPCINPVSAFSPSVVAESTDKEGQGGGQHQDMPKPADEVGIREESATSSPEGAGEGAVAFKFDREVNAAMLAKVPAETRLLAMQGLLASKVPEEAWQLTEAETDHYRALFPKPEPKRVRRRGSAQEGSKPLATLTPVVRQGMTAILTRLRKATRTEQEAQLVADQIAYMVENKGLGRGNALSGVYAGLKLVEDKRWSEPRDWPSVGMFWRGATFRALLDNSVDAHRNVH